jgi:hypothetical protein
MPAQHCLRPNDRKRAASVREQPADPTERQPVQPRERRSLRPQTLQHIDLLSQSQDLCLQTGSRPEQINHQSKDQLEEIQHQCRIARFPSDSQPDLFYDRDRSDPDILAGASPTLGKLIKDRRDAEGREDVRRDLQVELAPDRPGLRVGRCPQIDLAAHDHVDELVRGREPLPLDPKRILRIGMAKRVDGDALAGALEIAERRPPPCIKQRLDRRIGVLRCVVDLRDVMDRRYAIVELGEPSEQFIDVHVLRTVHRGKFEQNVLVIGPASARRARPVIDQNAIGEPAAQRRLELVVCISMNGASANTA